MTRPLETRPSRPALPARSTPSPITRALAALGWLGLPLIAVPGTAAAQAAAAQLDRVEIIGVSPLPGQGIDRNILPYSTQVLKRDAIDSAQTVNQSDYLNRRVVGVQVIPAAQGTQDPSAAQTLPAPQEVPGGRRAPSRHTAAPEAQFCSWRRSNPSNAPIPRAIPSSSSRRASRWARCLPTTRSPPCRLSRSAMPASG